MSKDTNQLDIKPYTVSDGRITTLTINGDVMNLSPFPFEHLPAIIKIIQEYHTTKTDWENIRAEYNMAKERLTNIDHQYQQAHLAFRNLVGIPVLEGTDKKEIGAIKPEEIPEPETIQKPVLDKPVEKEIEATEQEEIPELETIQEPVLDEPVEKEIRVSELTPMEKQIYNILLQHPTDGCKLQDIADATHRPPKNIWKNCKKLVTQGTFVKEGKRYYPL